MTTMQDKKLPMSCKRSLWQNSADYVQGWAWLVAVWNALGVSILGQQVVFSRGCELGCPQ